MNVRSWPACRLVAALALLSSVAYAAACKPFDEESAPAPDGAAPLPPAGGANAGGAGASDAAGAPPTRLAFVTSVDVEAALGPKPSDC